MNKLHLLVIVTGLGLLLGVTPSWGQAPMCNLPGCNPTSSDPGGNTAGGTDALFSEADPAPGNNTAFGSHALYSNVAGLLNTAVGAFALNSNTGLPNGNGEGNVAIGYGVLYQNNGNLNTATGTEAMYSNTSGGGNTASGYQVLYFNTGGNQNTASGYQALHFNTLGSGNTANGYNALYSNIMGMGNAAIGYQALYSNTGNENTASGVNTLYGNTTGGNNIGLGFNAGMNLTTGSNNIDIGDAGVAGESNTIRIGTNGMQSRAFIAGVSGKNVKGAEVVISSTGQLGVVKSSARYKRDIRDMGDASSKLMKLRPVTFRYREDSTGTIQYGLVAEEVARLYPELVIYGEDGKVETIRYSELTGMLLNELQKRRSENARQAAQIKQLSAQMVEVRASFEQRLSALEQTTRVHSGGRKLAVAFDR